MKTDLKEKWLNAGGVVLLWLAMVSIGSAQKTEESENAGETGLKSVPAEEAPPAEDAPPAEASTDAGAAPAGPPAGGPAGGAPEGKETGIPGTEEAADGGPGAPPSEPAPAPASGTVTPEQDLPNAAAAAIPAQYGLYRYEPIWKNSPFMLETPLTTVVAESFAKDLAVTSVSTIEGRTRVGYVNTKTRATGSATNEAPNEAGILVASVQSNPDPNKVVVEFSQGGKTAKVSYDPMTLQGKPTIPRAATIPGVAAGPPGSIPGVRPPGAGQVAPGQIPTSLQDRSAATRRRIVLPKSVTGGSPPVPPQAAPVPEASPTDLQPPSQ